MNSLVFLEAAAQGDAADALVESNASLIDFAVSEVDSLLQENAITVSDNIGLFIAEDHIQTSDLIASFSSELIIEATSTFTSIISSDVSDLEKRSLIEAYSYSYSMENIEIMESFKHGIGGMASSAGGAAIGGAVGSKIGNASSKLSISYVRLKRLISKETSIRDKLKTTNSPKLKQELALVIKSKNDAKIEYERVRSKRSTIGATIGGTVGGVAASSAYDSKVAGNGTFGKNVKTGATAIAAGAAGGFVGKHVAQLTTIFSKKRKIWKSLISQEKEIRDQLSKGKNQALTNKLKAIVKSKEKAKSEYDAIKSKAGNIGSTVGGIAGSFAPGILRRTPIGRVL